MKKLNLTTEWVLDKLSTSWMVTEKGCVLQVNLKDGIMESHLVELALQTMGVNYWFNTIGYPNEAIDEYRFNLEDIKKDCPNLFLKMEKNNNEN